ncbi:Fe2+-enterobactin ABC transporter substrate-binding protein [Leucothrix sargassi]|nr:Fe2+-enterobactin ABC transporter substrate-binding protein [Leucothrix sargassi]
MKKYHLIFSLLLSLLAALATPASAADSWPRTIENADGSVVIIKSPPKRILSTSASVTGTLLAINAPVVASGSAINGEFFAQWKDVAEQRELINVWPAGKIDLEAAYGVNPDLIIVSTTGADSVMAHVSLLKSIAPVLIVNYSDKDWQTLAKRLNRALGDEVDASALIARFEQHVANTRNAMIIPEGAVDLVYYTGGGSVSYVGLASSTQGQLYQALGFSLAALDPQFKAKKQHSHFVEVEHEQLSLLKGQTTFLMRRGVSDQNSFTQDPILQNLPSVTNKHVWGMGENSFRVDYYSAMEIVNNMAKLFAKK